MGRGKSQTYNNEQKVSGIPAMRGMILFLWTSSYLLSGGDWKQAEELYQKTDYKGSLALLHGAASPDAGGHFLAGRDYFMLGDYKKATDAFQKAVALEPGNSIYVHWLGRTFGRRAETSNPFAAPMYASKARQFFEKAVALDAANDEAMNDLFDFYLQAPGFLGGGYDKAEELAKRIAQRNEAEGHFAQAQLADKRKQFDTAEEQLRRAMELAPKQVGRVLDLAKYQAKRGRYQESEAQFDRAEKLAPNSPKVYFARAHCYIQTKRNPDRARVLLNKYLQSELTPDDPSREEAQKLLRQLSGS
jgi:tetratricopeptide (TPR) repeat protein